MKVLDGPPTRKAVLLPAAIVATFLAAVFPLRWQRDEEQRRLQRLSEKAIEAAADVCRHVVQRALSRDVDVVEAAAVIEETHPGWKVYGPQRRLFASMSDSKQIDAISDC